jgi:protein tyrosine/serine phosphatase
MMRIYAVHPHLFLSARTHQLSDEELDKFLNMLKLTGVVNMWHTADPRVQARVQWYEHHSIADGKANKQSMWLAGQIADKVSHEITKGGRVLCHCWGGRNRSGLVVALALMRLQGITGAEAVRAVKAVRSGALVNQHFVEYLEGLKI